MKHLIIRALIFSVLIGLLYGVGGFEPPQVSRENASRDDFKASRRRAAAWFPSIALYVAGAAVAVWGDRKSGTLHPTSTRFTYILAGTVAMVAGLVWSQTVKSTASMRLHTHAGQGAKILKT